MSENKSILEQRLSTYGESHQNAQNVLIHKFCVPAIVLSIIGILSTIPFPWSANPWLHWGTALSIGMLSYYFLLSFSYALFMCLYVGLCMGIVYFSKVKLSLQENVILWVLVFVLAWIGQFIGHKIEGKKPSFFDDIRYLLVGPLWVFHAIKTKNKGN
jgi:uncharacterized membrane protein YGL010W